MTPAEQGVMRVALEKYLASQRAAVAKLDPMFHKSASARRWRHIHADNALIANRLLKNLDNGEGS